MSHFIPHGYCLNWNARLIWLWVIGDGLTGISYLSIPISLAVLLWREWEGLSLRHKLSLILFAAFILLCGATHFIDIATIWAPVYWVKAIVTLATAAVSVIAAVYLIPTTREAMRMPRRITTLTADLEQSEERAQLEARMREASKAESVGLLAGGIAHDFNNLIAVTLSNASLALSIGAPETLVPMLEDIVSASERAALLTRQLLSYAGKAKPKVESINISTFAGQVVHLLRASIPKSIEIRLQLERDLPPVDADVAQLQQVVMNLVINAAEAINGYMGVISIRTGTQAIDEHYIQTALLPGEIVPGSYIFIEVQDTGCGMTPETMGRIFEPCFTTKFTGRGLGLAAVLGIIKAHRGVIRVYSTLGKGTTFKILLPVSGSAQVEPNAPTLPTAIGAGERDVVLVVDDEAPIRIVARKMLEKCGYQVYIAANGRECIELIKALHGRVSVVLLDMTMPVMSGPDTLKAIKDLVPMVPVILTSGYNEVEANEMIGGGAAFFLQKPYTARMLAETIRAAIHPQS